MSDGTRFLTIPRNNPVNAFTMGGSDMVFFTAVPIESYVLTS